MELHEFELDDRARSCFAASQALALASGLPAGSTASTVPLDTLSAELQMLWAIQQAEMLQAFWEPPPAEDVPQSEPPSPSASF